jgi:hypothetical protein
MEVRRKTPRTARRSSEVLLICGAGHRGGSQEYFSLNCPSSLSEGLWIPSSNTSATAS